MITLNNSILIIISNLSSFGCLDNFIHFDENFLYKHMSIIKYLIIDSLIAFEASSASFVFS